MDEHDHEQVPAAQPAVEVLAALDTTGEVYDRPRRRRAGLVAGVATFAVLLAAGGGYAAWQALSGGGPHPDSVLPASTLAVAEVDLDPSAGQKLELYRLLQRFPHSAQLQDTDKDVADWLMRRLAEGGDAAGLDFAKDVQPWLGKRFAVAAVPADGPAGVGAVLVLQETDEQAATAAMTKLRGTGSDGLGFAFMNGFLVVSPGSSTTARRTVDAARGAPLAADPRFRGDIAALGGDQVVTAWVDAEKAGAAMGTAVRSAMGGLDVAGLAGGQGADPTGLAGVLGGTPTWKGRWALGAHVSDGTVELTVQTFGGDPQPAPKPVSLDATVPDAWAVVALSGADRRVADAWKQAGSAASLGMLAAQARSLGLTLPDDLEALLGSQLTVSVGGREGQEPTFLAVSQSGDPQHAKQVLDRVLAKAGPGAPPVSSAVRDGRLYAGSSDAVVASAARGTVQDTDLFKRAVVGADTAQLVVYVDLRRALATSGATDPEVGQLAAVGLSTHSDGDRSTLTLRLVLT